MSLIQIRNVWKEYDSKVVLERISFDVEDGAFVALVGPSGCGKTTFLRMMLGEEQPDRGTILLGGAPLPAEPGADRGVVFQRYSVFPHLTALENVLLGAEFGKSRLAGKLFGAARRDAAGTARDMLAEVGLADAADKYPAQLSGGMQQRLALAQALLTKPKILLLDEPFGALDPGIKGDIHRLMIDLWRSCGMTVFMVTHDLSEAFLLATRVIVFERPRDGGVDNERYGASITRDMKVWPQKN